MKLVNGHRMGVYRWTNTVNGKVYIGSATKTLQGRYDGYIRDFARGYCHNRHLLRAWQKYGGRAFVFEVLEFCVTATVCLARETWWIAKHDSTNQSKGYNICREGKNQIGTKRSTEAKAKMRAAKVGKKQAPEHTAKILAKNRGRRLSEEQKAKLKASHWSKGPKAKETTAKIRTANVGKTIPAEQRAKISATLTGRKATEESKEKKRQTWAAKTDDEKAAISERLSESHKGYVKSEEHRARLAEAAKRQHERRRAEKAVKRVLPSEIIPLPPGECGD